MKAVLFFFSVIIALPVLADIAPSPMSLHRIGYDILAEVVGSVVVGGAALRALIRRCRGLDGDDADSPCDTASQLRGEENSLSKGLWVLWPGGPEGRLAERSEDGAELRFLEDDEVSEIEHKLEVALPTLRESFEKKYEVESKAWLKDEDCPRVEERESWWKERCEELVIAILLQDELLRQRLKGVPIEWVVNCVRKEPRRTGRERFCRMLDGWHACFRHPLVYLYEFVGGSWRPSVRRSLRVRTESIEEVRMKFNSVAEFIKSRRGFISPFYSSAGAMCLELKRLLLQRRGKRRVSWAGMVVIAYLVELILMKFGIVDISLHSVGVRALEMILYPLAALLLFGGVVLVSLVAFVEIGQWYRNRKLRRIVARREKLLADYHCETTWRVPVPECSLLKDGFAVGGIGGACDATLRLNYVGVAGHHAEIYFDKRNRTLGGSGFAVRGLGWSWIGEHVKGRLPKKEKVVELNVGREISVGPYAILKVVSVPSKEDNAFVFELVDGKRREEKETKELSPDMTAVQLEPSEDFVSLACEDAFEQKPFVAEGHGGVVFGRSCRSDVRLAEQDVSGRHVEIVSEGDQILAVCLSRQGMFVNDRAVETSGRRQLHEGDHMRIGMTTEVCVVRLPKDGDDEMVLNVTDSHGTREETVRLPMVAEGALRKDVAGEDSGLLWF